MNDQLAELETRIAFQENTIQKLDDVITQQQKQIDLLQGEIQLLKSQMENMAASLVVSESEETPPPHY
jgi:SlyX protein